MRRAVFLLLGFLITACTAPVLPPTPTVWIPTPLPPSLTITPSNSPPTLTASPTDTVAPTGTPTEAATVTMTGTPVPLVHVFPIQPPESGGFAEGTSSHGYPATDIFAVVGTKFVAVTDGVVDFVSYKDLWDPNLDDPALRGGLSVAIIGDDGVRYYGSHLSAIAVGIVPGSRVTAGQLLGLVGNTGDALNTLSHLHFGISIPTYPDDWKIRRGQVDPFPFLQAWRDGHNVTPPLPIETETLTETPNKTPNLFTHVFPIQPTAVGGFSEGGHPYPATDIFAPLGTKFVAVTNGTVDLVSYSDQWDAASNDVSTSGGLCVRIIGDDGVRYYGAHLSAIAKGIRPGVWVAAGQLLGLVGNTGDARNSTPHVHFEISSPVYPFALVDPYPLLLAWRDGQNITPPLSIP